MDDYGYQSDRKLSDADVNAIISGLAGTRFVGPEEHYEHHRWTASEIEIKKEVYEMRRWVAKKMAEEEDRSSDHRQLRLKVFGWAIISTIAIAALELGELAFEAVKAAINT